MKILWVVNTIFPYPAKELGIKKTAFGGWLNGLAENLKNEKEIELAIVAPYSCKSIQKFYDGVVTYYLFPSVSGIKYNKKFDVYAKEILREFCPDIVHIHGTEYAHGLSYINNCDDSTKKLVSIQGLTTCISNVYLAGIDYKEVIKNITFRDLLKKDNIFQQRNKFKKRAVYEKQIIEKCEYVIGRTDWDKYNALTLNNNLKYFYLPETVKKEFYNNKWNIHDVERHSIYLSQGSYPIKGLHMLLKSIKIVKNKYPDVKLYVSGDNIVKNDTFLRKVKLSGYGKYINTLIKKYNLESNVEFTGILDEKKVIERMLKTHIVVVPSVVENESNSLTEAHLLAMPTIAAYSGGMTERIIHKKTGFLYPYFEYSMCAGYIMEYFNNDNLAVEYGKNAYEIARVRNAPEGNVAKILDIYNQILKGE